MFLTSLHDRTLSILNTEIETSKFKLFEDDKEGNVPNRNRMQTHQEYSQLLHKTQNLDI